MKQSVLKYLWGVLIISLVSPMLHLHAEPPNSESQRLEVFRFGVLNLIDGAHHKDAQVAIELNFVSRHKDQFPGISAELKIVEDVDSAVSLLEQQWLHGIALSGTDYLSLKGKAPVLPLVISSRQDKPTEAYVLLVSKHVESIEHLSTFEQRRLVMEEYGETHIGRMWLDTVLWEMGQQRSASFFTAERRATKPTRVVLPVFFGQAEACLVPESTFNAMAALNPQIGQHLRVLVRSPEFVRSVTCASVHLDAEVLDVFRQNVLETSTTADGQQLMMIFRFKRHYAFDPAYMKETETVFRKYHDILSKQ